MESNIQSVRSVRTKLLRPPHLEMMSPPPCSSPSFNRQQNERRRRHSSLQFIVSSILYFFITPELSQECIPPLQTSEQRVYLVGVLAIRGIQAAYDEFNATFSDYLTSAVGARFDPPIRFEMRPLDFQLSNVEEMDFLYVNPFAFSCVESEIGAQSLVSQVSRRVVGGNVYNLTKFGGIIFVGADSDIRTIQDIKGKVVACASIIGLGSGQMQFRELQQAGLSYINDPKQIVFTFSQQKVVDGVLGGDFDVGFVRTDQIERSLGEEYSSKIRENLSIDGVPFPFQSSTPLYPEWNVASLPSVPSNVAIEVQQAMLALADHATAGSSITACYAENDCEGSGDIEESKSSCEEAVEFSRCDTSVPIALAASTAITNGGYARFRMTLSYVELHHRQEETQFLSNNNDTDLRQCVRSSDVYDAIVCPDGHYKKPTEDVADACMAAGLGCNEDFRCICAPCEKAFEVAVFPVQHISSTGCSKLELCGTIEQTKKLTFRAVDNKKRGGLDLTARILEGTKTREIKARPVLNRVTGTNAANATSNIYEFTVGSNRAGVLLLEILANGEHIEASPIRVEVQERDCAAQFQDVRLQADSEGNCVCNANSVSVAAKCVPYSLVISSILLPILVLVMFGIYIFVQKKRKEADSVWTVKKSELLFHDPPEIIGRGTFGLVLLAEYRGTQVAVKRVIPPRTTYKTRQKVATSDSSCCSTTSFDVERGATNVEKSEIKVELDDNLPPRCSFKDIGNEAFDFADEEGTPGEAGVPLQFHDDTSLHSKPSRMSRSRSMGHAPASSLDSEEQTGIESVRMSRRHSVGGSTTNLTRKGPSPVIHPDADDYGTQRRMSLEATVCTAFDFENGEQSLSKTDTDGIVPVSFTTTSGSVVGIQTVSTSFYESKRGQKRFFCLPWSRRDEYCRRKDDFIEEMRHLSKLRHPCITTVMGAVIPRRDEPMLVMEYMEMGSLYDILHNETMLLEGELVLPILRDITQSMRFLHAASPPVIHGDLKALNVLVDIKFRAKVSDFGLSQKQHAPFWMAPELLRGESDNTAASDVYSFGIILYEVYSRQDPYKGENMTEVLNQVANHLLNKRPPVPPSCPPLAASLMSDCLVANPADRPTFEDLDLRIKRLHASSVEPGKMRLSWQTKKEHRKSDLLNDFFPTKVAEALREGRKVEPEARDCVTIFFSDIVGFTQIASTMSPIQISDMLDRLYKRFDTLTHKHDVFKVETIGDAYMAATNLVKDQGDHVKRIAEFAIDAVKAASGTLVNASDPSKGFVKVRIGFHSGPVVANVVGSRCPRYSLFGDTVNIASRMESTSQENRIQCSDRSAGMLLTDHPEIRLLSRGYIKVKGRGEIHTYWVNEDCIEPAPGSSTNCQSDEHRKPTKRKRLTQN